VSGVHRQLGSLQLQREQLARDVRANDAVGRELRARLAHVALGGRDLTRLATFLVEQDKVVLLLLSLQGRLERAEEELSNTTDAAGRERERRERARDGAKERLGEASGLRRLNERRLGQLVGLLEERGLARERELLVRFVSAKEELLRARSTCDRMERDMLA
jgi:hypothetical protein